MNPKQQLRSLHAKNNTFKTDMALSYFAASSNLRNACYTPTVFLFLNPISYANLISGGNKLTMMLCANADELPTHLYCFALQFVIQSTRNQQSSPNQTRAVYPTQPSAMSGGCPAAAVHKHLHQKELSVYIYHSPGNPQSQPHSHHKSGPWRSSSCEPQTGKDANCSHSYELP